VSEEDLAPYAEALDLGIPSVIETVVFEIVSEKLGYTVEDATIQRTLYKGRIAVEVA
jgi:hypothetical protein